MESHEVLRRAFEKSSPKAIASELSLSLSLVYKWAEKPTEDGSGSRNPLDRLLKIIEVTGDQRIIEWLCRRCGGYFVPNPAARDEDYDLLPVTQEIVAQFSAMLTDISRAAIDHAITPPEAGEIRESWDKLKSYTEGFVACCEQGDFDRLENIPSPSKGPRRLGV
jgi:hypothetical protein